MFFGNMRENREDKVTLKETSLEAFKILLKYVYSGKMEIAESELELILEVLELANRYGFDVPFKNIEEFLMVRKGEGVCLFCLSLICQPKSDLVYQNRQKTFLNLLGQLENS